MSVRIGRSYLIDHGSGRVTLRVVVRQLKRESFELAVFDVGDAPLSYLFAGELFSFGVDTLDNWERLGGTGRDGNYHPVRRLA